MRACVHNEILIGGEISDVRFSPQKDKAIVEFDDGFAMEFSNKKKNRAEHVKMLRLKKGEHVISIGGISGASSLYGYGYEIMRSGRVSEGSYSLIRGRIETLIKSHISLAKVITDSGETLKVCLSPSDAKNLKKGDYISALCRYERLTVCEKACSSFSIQKCAACKKKRDGRLYALIVE